MGNAREVVTDNIVDIGLVEPPPILAINVHTILWCHSRQQKKSFQKDNGE